MCEKGVGGLGDGRPQWSQGAKNAEAYLLMNA